MMTEPSSELAQAVALEAEVVQRGVWVDYVNAVLDDVFGESARYIEPFGTAVELGGVKCPASPDEGIGEGYSFIWTLITMPPAQRIEAARRVLAAPA